MWCDYPIPSRAPAGGIVDPLNGHAYTGGEFLPFYVPRPIMPQVDEADYPELIAFARARRVTVSREIVAPSSLRPHQRIDRIHLRRLPPEVLCKPVLVSSDGFILDGNHRWKAHCILREELHVIRLGLPFEEAIRLLFEFPKTYDLADREERN